MILNRNAKPVATSGFVLSIFFIFFSCQTYSIHHSVPISSRSSPYRINSEIGSDSKIRIVPVNSPLHLAVRNNDLKIVRTLLEKGVPVNAIGEDFKTPMMLAVNNGNIEIVRLLFQNGGEIHIENDVAVQQYMYTYRETLLHMAAGSENANPAVVKFLLDKGLSVDARDQLENTPLIRGNEKPRIIKILLEHGANPNLKNIDGTTPLLSTIHFIRPSSAELRKIQDENSLIVIDMLVAAGANINEPNNDGETPLLHSVEIAAMAKDNTRIIEKLLEKGADRSIRDHMNRTALDIARKYGRYDIVHLLNR